MDRQMVTITYSLFLWYMLFMIVPCCISNVETVVSTSHFSISIFSTFSEYSTTEYYLSIYVATTERGKKRNINGIWVKGRISKERKEPVAFLLGLLAPLMPLKFHNVIWQFYFNNKKEKKQEKEKKFLFCFSVVWHQRHRLCAGKAQFIRWKDQFQQTLNSQRNYYFYFF